MKLRSPWVGSAKGKMGDGVYYRRRGVQCARARAIEISNPQSQQQMVTRAAFSTATKLAASLNAEIISHSFESKTYGEASRNYFVSLATKLFRQRINEALGGEYHGFAPIVGKMATFGNIANNLRISQGSLPSHSCAVSNPEVDGAAENFARVGFQTPIARREAFAQLTVAQFEQVFGVDKTGQVTFVIFENVDETESLPEVLHCATPRVFRFSLKKDVEDTALLFTQVQDESYYVVNTAIVDADRSSLDISALHFIGSSSNSFSVGLGDAIQSDPDIQTIDVIQLSADTQGMGFAIITSKWVDGAWLRSTDVIYAADGPTNDAKWMSNATAWNNALTALSSYTKSGSSETNDRYLNKEKN